MADVRTHSDFFHVVVKAVLVLTSNVWNNRYIVGMKYLKKGLHPHLFNFNFIRNYR